MTTTYIRYGCKRANFEYFAFNMQNSFYFAEKNIAK